MPRQRKGGGRFTADLKRSIRGEARLALSGELDVATSHDVRSAVRAALGGSNCVTLDLSGLSFLDATGARTLRELKAAASREGRQLRVTGARGAVRRVLELLQARDLLD